MDSRGVGRHQRVEFTERVSDRAAVEASHKLPVGEIDFVNVSDVAIVDLLVVVVLDLHDLVAPRKDPSETLDLLVASWIQCRLQLNIERASTHTASVHWAKDLNVADGVETEARRNPGFHELDDALRGDFWLFRLHEVEIAIVSRGAEIGNYALVDAVGGGDDAGLRGLPEHLGQSDHGYGAGRDYIREHLPRPHGGELVNIANDQESGGGRHSLDERLHQHDVHHGSFVDNQQVAIERIVVAALEPTRLRIDFEQPVNGFGLETRCFGHPLGGAPGGRTKQELHAFCCKDP